MFIKLKAAFRNCRRNWLFNLAPFLLLSCCVAIPTMMSGVYNGMYRTVRDKLSDVYGGDYFVYAYWDGDANTSFIPAQLASKIDDTLSERFRGRFLGSDKIIRRTLPDPIGVLASRTDVPDGTLMVHEGSSLRDRQGYSFIGSTGTVDFRIQPIPVPEYQDNVFRTVETPFFTSKMSYASYETARELLGLETGDCTYLRLRFKGEPEFSDIQETLSTIAPLQKERSVADSLLWLIPQNSMWDGVRFNIPDFDKNLVWEISKIMNSGRAEETTARIQERRRMADYLAYIISILCIFTSTVMLQIILLNRKDEIVTYRLLGADRKTVVGIIALEQLCLSILSVILAFIGLIGFKYWWESVDNSSQYMATFFGYSGHYHFMPDPWTVCFSLVCAFIIPQVAIYPTLIPILRPSPAQAMADHGGNNEQAQKKRGGKRPKKDR